MPGGIGKPFRNGRLEPLLIETLVDVKVMAHRINGRPLGENRGEGRIFLDGCLDGGEQAQCPGNVAVCVEAALLLQRNRASQQCVASGPVDSAGVHGVGRSIDEDLVIALRLQSKLSQSQRVARRRGAARIERRLRRQDCHEGRHHRNELQDNRGAQTTELNHGSTLTAST